MPHGERGGERDVQALRREMRVLQVQVDELREQDAIKEQHLLRLLHEHHVRKQEHLKNAFEAHVRHVGTLTASESAKKENCAAQFSHWPHFVTGGGLFKGTIFLASESGQYYKAI